MPQVSNEDVESLEPSSVFVQPPRVVGKHWQNTGETVPGSFARTPKPTERDRHPPTEKERDGETRTHECKHQFYSALVDLIFPLCEPCSCGTALPPFGAVVVSQVTSILNALSSNPYEAELLPIFSIELNNKHDERPPNSVSIGDELRLTGVLENG